MFVLLHVCVCVFMWACVCVCVCVWACVSPTCPSYVSQGRGFAVGLERTWTPMFSLIKNPLPLSWPSVPLVFKAVGSWRYPIQSVCRVMQMLGGFLLCWLLAIASDLCLRKHSSTVFLLKNGVLTFKSPQITGVWFQAYMSVCLCTILTKSIITFTFN